MSIKIEKGVPMKTRRQGNYWPFSEMEVGDSFEVFNDDHRAFACAAYQAAQRYRFKTGNANFGISVRKSGGGHSRVWRVK